MQVVEITHEIHRPVTGLKGNTRRRIQVANRYGWKCYWCSQSTRRENGYCNTATIEHLVPRSHGGRNHVENLASACWRCNVVRGVQKEQEFALRAKDFEPDTRTIEQFYKVKKQASTQAKEHDHKLALLAFRTNSPHLVADNERAKMQYLKMVRNNRPPRMPAPQPPLPWYKKLIVKLGQIVQSLNPLRT